MSHTITYECGCTMAAVSIHHYYEREYICGAHKSTITSPPLFLDEFAAASMPPAATFMPPGVAEVSPADIAGFGVPPSYPYEMNVKEVYEDLLKQGEPVDGFEQMKQRLAQRLPPEIKADVDSWVAYAEDKLVIPPCVKERLTSVVTPFTPEERNVLLAVLAIRQFEVLREKRDVERYFANGDACRAKLTALSIESAALAGALKKLT